MPPGSGLDQLREDTAELLTQFTLIYPHIPPSPQVLLVNSGSEATDLAMRLARCAGGWRLEVGDIWYRKP